MILWGLYNIYSWECAESFVSKIAERLLRVECKLLIKDNSCFSKEFLLWWCSSRSRSRSSSRSRRRTGMLQCTRIRSVFGIHQRYQKKNLKIQTLIQVHIHIHICTCIFVCLYFQFFFIYTSIFVFPVVLLCLWILGCTNSRAGLEFCFLLHIKTICICHPYLNLYLYLSPIFVFVSVFVSSFGGCISWTGMLLVASYQNHPTLHVWTRETHGTATLHVWTLD